MSKGNIIVISGPSGSGKTTIFQELVKNPTLRRKITRTISATTRLPRRGEKHGRDYFFLSHRAFEAKIKAGQFLEHEKVFNNYYGTLKSQVKALIARGKTVVLAIDVNGARSVKKAFPQTRLIFIKPPSMSALRKRLVKRGSEDQATLRVRLKRAAMEMKQARHYDDVVINDSLSKAAKALAKIVSAQICKKADPARPASSSF